jgi:hypothetical protein
MLQSRTPLDRLRVEQPCRHDWDAMPGNDRVRYCSACGLHVHNLSAMPREEAERLVCERAGRLCVRLERTAGGRIRTLDYEPIEDPARRRRRWLGLIVSGFGGAAVAVGGGLRFWMQRNQPPPPTAAQQSWGEFGDAVMMPTDDDSGA